MNIQESITQLKQFRQGLFEIFPKRAGALTDLLDALANNTTARSVVELSLNPLFRYGYSSVYDGIDNFFEATSTEVASTERREQEQEIIRMIVPLVPMPQKFWLLGVDVTPEPRLFARTLEDRTFVHQSTPIIGNKPITIGHQYSGLVLFPEKEETEPPWVVSLSMRRVTSREVKTAVGAEQVKALLEDKTLPFGDDLCVQVVDSAYSAVKFLGRVAPYNNLVTIARIRGNRVLYRTPPPTEGKRSRGHPIWYGKRFDLKDPTTWDEPDEVVWTTCTTRGGKTYTVCIERWDDMLMRGTREFPMHKHPFSLIRIRVFDSDGKLVFKHPLWLIAIGSRRYEISSLDSWKSYNRRYDIEHFFRFGKQRLLMTAFQTPDVEHEENWWKIVQLAYLQLWLARPLAEAMPRPWERYLPQFKTGVASPSVVQRDFGRIIRQIGKPAAPPKPRGKSQGRKKGEKPGCRKRHPVIRKGAKGSKKTKMSK